MTEDGVRFLTPLAPTLRELSIGYQHTLEADTLCHALADSLPQLQHLDLLSDELSDAGMEALGRLKNLRALLLWQAAHVSNCKLLLACTRCSMTACASSKL